MLIDGEKMWKFCDWSIELDPRHAEPYAIRGKYERQNIYLGLAKESIEEDYGLSEEELRNYFGKWRSDLEKSCELLSEWALSRDLLSELNEYEKKYL